jgi:putative heme degradation protein
VFHHIVGQRTLDLYQAQSTAEQVTYENDLQVGTLRGFIVGDPIVEIFNGDVTLFNRSGWINLKDRDISLKVKRGHIKKVKDNA